MNHPNRVGPSEADLVLDGAIKALSAIVAGSAVLAVVFYLRDITRGIGDLQDTLDDRMRFQERIAVSRERRRISAALTRALAPGAEGDESDRVAVRNVQAITARLADANPATASSGGTPDTTADILAALAHITTGPSTGPNAQPVPDRPTD